jgi:chromosome segregation ATPase
MATDGKNPAGEGKGEEATTTIDSLLELLKSGGKMELSKIANTLKVNPSIVEGWAKVLEGGGLVKISYEVGRMYVEPAGVSKEQESTIRATVAAEKDALAFEVAHQRGDLEAFSKKLDEISGFVNADETAFKERLPLIQEHLESINKIYEALLAEDKRAAGMAKSTEAAYDSINKKISTLYSKIDTIDTSTVDRAKAELLKIQNALSKAAELEGQFALLTKSKDKALDAIRKSIETQHKELEKEAANAEKSIDAQLAAYKTEMESGYKALKDQARTTSSVAEQITRFAKEKEFAKQSLSTARDSFNDEYAKTYGRMKNTEEILKKEITKLTTELDQLKDSFGAASKAYDDLEKTRLEIEELKKTIAQMGEEAEKVEETISSLDSAKLSTEEKAKAVGEVKRKRDKIAKSSSDIGGKINDIEGKFDDERK